MILRFSTKSENFRVKPHSHNWCTWPKFGVGSYLPCHRIGILVQLFVSSAVSDNYREMWRKSKERPLLVLLIPRPVFVDHEKE